MWGNEESRREQLADVITSPIRAMEGYLQRRIEACTAVPVNTSLVVRALAGSVLASLLLSKPGQERPDLETDDERLVNELVGFFLLG